MTSWGDEGSCFDVVHGRIVYLLRRFLRFAADSGGDVAMPSDFARLRELGKQQGRVCGDCRMHGRNDCLADSLFQALAHAGAIEMLKVLIESL